MKTMFTVLVVAALCGCARNERAEAEALAKKEVHNLLVGVQKLSEMTCEPYGTNGRAYRISFMADGLNKFGGPAREKVVMALWKAKAKDGTQTWMVHLDEFPEQ